MKGASSKSSLARGKIAVLAAIPFCMALAFWWVHPNIAFDADSPRYLAGSPMRTTTYPLFLKLAYGPTLLPLQLLLFAAALSWLAVHSSKFLPFVLSAALVLAIGANPYLWQLQATVMGEALTTPLLTLVVGCILAFVVGGCRVPIIAAAVLGGIATTVRPSCLPFILAPVCAVWIAPNLQGRMKLLALVLIVWAIPIGAERLYSRAVHGSELTSPLGRHAFMKAAVIDAPATTISSGDPLDHRLVQALNQDFEPVRRLLHKAPDRNVRYILLSNYEACAAWACGNAIAAGFPVSEADLHRHLLGVGLARLESNPEGYLELTATEYHRMWLLHPRKDPDLAPQYNAFLKREAPLPFQPLLDVESRPTPASEQKPILRLNRAAFAGVGILAAVLTIAFAFWHRSALTRATFSLLLGTQAVLVFSAFVAAGLPRYTMGLWPTLIAGLVFGVAGLVNLWKLSVGGRGPEGRVPSANSV